MFLALIGSRKQVLTHYAFYGVPSSWWKASALDVVSKEVEAPQAVCWFLSFDTSARVKSNLAFQLVWLIGFVFSQKVLKLARNQRNQLSPNLGRWEHWFGILRTLLLFRWKAMFSRGIFNKNNNDSLKPIGCWALSKQLLEACGKDACKEGLQAEERKAGADLRTW